MTSAETVRKLHNLDTGRATPRASARLTLAVALLACGLVGAGCSGGDRPGTSAQAASERSSRRAGSAATLPAAVPAPSSEPSPAPTPVQPPRQGREETERDADPTVLEVPAPGTSSRSKLAEKAARDHTLTVIDSAEGPREVSLAEAARKAREERGSAPASKIVITNDNLAEYATGQLTLASPAKSPDDTVSEEAAGSRLVQSEGYWRQATRELRLKLRRSWDEAQALEEQVAGLRLRFYAEDDPYLRDSEIKPAWDRALNRQRQAELEVKAYRRELEELLEEGRQAGALPGWLRDGIEHEPELEDEADAEREGSPEGFGRHEPVEPERMENPSRPPRR